MRGIIRSSFGVRAVGPSASSALRPNAAVVGGAVVVVAIFALFSLGYWNRFLNAPVSGVFVYVAEQLRDGRIPYRDFFLIVPPLHALKLAGLISLFGDALIIARAEALLERILLALIVYGWLQRHVTAASAALGTLAGMIVFAGDPADALVTYHHDSVLLAVGAGFVAVLAVSKRDGPRFHWAVISGVLAGLCLQTKQTTGVGITLAVPSLAFVAHYGGRDAAAGWRFAAGFGLGWILPNLAMVAWLASEGALGAFVQSVFQNSSAKGSGLTFWLRPILHAPAFVAMGMFVALLLHRSLSKASAMRRSISLPWLSGSFVVGLGVAIALSPVTNLALVNAGMRLQALVIVGSMGACAVFMVARGVRIMRGTADADDVGVWMLSGVSLAIAYMLGLSWYSYGPMAIPAVAVVFAFVAEDCQSARGLRRLFVLATVVLVLFTEAHRKYAMPSGWMAWSEPSVLESRYPSNVPQLIGLRLSAPTLDVTEKVTHLIKTHSRPGDPVFVFPYFPLFYVLAERTPPTFAYVHFMDVMPDHLAEREAERLQQNPPAVIVYLDRPKAVVELDEAVYRAGKPSGERFIMSAIRAMADRYSLLTTFSLPGTGFPLHVLVRKDRLDGPRSDLYEALSRGRR